MPTNAIANDIVPNMVVIIAVTRSSPPLDAAVLDDEGFNSRIAPQPQTQNLKDGYFKFQLSAPVGPDAHHERGGRYGGRNDERHYNSFGVRLDFGFPDEVRSVGFEYANAYGIAVDRGLNAAPDPT